VAACVSRRTSDKPSTWKALFSDSTGVTRGEDASLSDRQQRRCEPPLVGSSLPAPSARLEATRRASLTRAIQSVTDWFRRDRHLPRSSTQRSRGAYEVTSATSA
jgi:hypothetical protein